MTFIGHEKPRLEDLAHFGVKGMHWGVRKDDATGGSRTATGDYKAAHKAKPTPSLKDGAANLAKNEDKFKAKSDGSGGKNEEKGRLKTFVSDHKSAIIKTAVTGAVVAAIIIDAHVAAKKKRESHELYAGKEIPADVFAKHVMDSKMQTWAKNDYFKGDAFDRPEFSLPVGHEFHRISKVDEKDFGRATYSTHSKEDYDRYVAQFRQEKGGDGTKLRHVTFHAQEEIKVPALNTVLDTLKGVLSEHEPQATFQDSHVLSAYQDMSGGGWASGRAKNFFDVLERKGYGAIVDEMDAGVIGETPLVVFAKKMFGEKSSTPITSDDIDHSESNLIEINNRKFD